ncbi:MAG: MFS transporter [Planctomycetota bacterium]
MTESNLHLTDRDKSLLFWASFLSLAAAGFGFVFRVMIPTMWSEEFQITNAQVGSITGAALWPIAITMVLFSLIVDKVGYKLSMFCAFAFQAASVVLTVTAKDVDMLWWACFCAGLGHGVVEACINPLCASIYRNEKSKWLNILHASWPAGIVGGGVAYLTLVGADATDWASTKWIFWIMLLPVLAYGVMFALCHRYPVDERIEANVSMKEMLREFGGLGAGLASTFLIYEFLTQLKVDLGAWTPHKLYICLIAGAVIGVAFGFALQAVGRWLFFVLCLIMIPLATAELGTDAWIATLLRPIMGKEYAGWAIVFSAGIMMTLRFFAGIPLKVMNPPQLLLVSSVFSIAGLFALSEVTGALIFGAFVLYAIGQTFYWPTVLGFVSEQFPKGGAMTLNTVSAMGLLTVGIFGFPFLGAVQDSYNAKTVAEVEPEVFATAKADGTTFLDVTNPNEPKPVLIVEEKDFFGVPFTSVNTQEFMKLQALDEARDEKLKEALKSTGQSSLKVAGVLPLIMAIAFILIIIYYRLNGGYRVVHLRPSGEDPASTDG